MKILTHKYLKGFTIIELLIVIAILGVLAVALLITINPGEAQKKTRDAQRLAHLKTLQTLIDQFINDGNAATGAILTAGTGVSSTVAPAGAKNGQACGATSWLGINTCAYGATVPLDPNNGVTRTFVNATTPAVTTGPITAQYRAQITGSDYEVNVLQESVSNASKVSSDGGNNSAQWVEVGTSLTLLN